MEHEDEDTKLARLLSARGRVEVSTLQALLAQARASGGGLGRLLVHRGLIGAGELASLRSSFSSASSDSLAPDPRAESSTGLGNSLGSDSELRPKHWAGRQLPDQVAGYRLLDLLGAGGMGAVYLAEHLQTKGRVAIKLLHLRSSGLRLERFRREGEAQARSDGHPNVARVHSAGQVGEYLYLVMDLCTGGDLEKRLERLGPLDPSLAAEICEALAEGLHHVHQQGILHRDLKPANVLFDEHGCAKLVDFGLARVSDAESLTKTGALLGTPAYMAPEQARGETRAVDERTDVHALGLILFEMLTGERPFAGDGIGLLRAIIQDEAPKLRKLRAEIPVGLEGICARALSKDPADRFQTAAELAEALRRGDSGVAPRRSFAPALLLATVTVLLALLGGAALARSSAAEQDRVEAEALALRFDLEGLEQKVLAALRSERPLSSDASLPVALREQLTRLEARASEERVLRRCEANLLVLEGLMALSAGDLKAARAALRAGRGFETSDEQASAALKGGLAALTPNGDPQAALVELERGQEGGTFRPDLTKWRAKAEVRLALSMISEGRAAEALETAGNSQALKSLSDEERLAAAGEALRWARLTVGQVERAQAGEASPPAELVELLRSQLRFARTLSPRGVLEEAELTRLVALATHPRRSLSVDFDLEVAEQRPDRLELQEAILKRTLWVPPNPKSRWHYAKLFLPLAYRAARLAPPERRLHFQEVLGDVLTNSWEWAKAGELAEALLEEDPISDALRAKAHYWRANSLYFVNKDYAAAVAQAEASLKVDGNCFLAYDRIARAAYRLKDYAKAHQASVAYVTQVDARITGQYSNIYKDSSVRAFVCSRQLATPRAYAEAGVAIERMLATWNSASYAGWWIRLAYVQLRGKGPSEAIRSLKTALTRLPLHPKTRTFVGETRRVLEIVESSGKEGIQPLRKLVIKLEKLRAGRLTP
jgi:tetratricopeptide (TPR) repeat protein